jgi:IS1 family transposase
VKACEAFHDATVRNVAAKRVQCDEIWSFVASKQRNTSPAKRMRGEAGDVWTWTALDSDSKLIVNWTVGDRSGATATMFMEGVAERLAGRVQLTTDGHKAYILAVDKAFGDDVDYAMLDKIYGESLERGPGAPDESVRRANFMARFADRRPIDRESAEDLPPVFDERG